MDYDFRYVDGQLSEVRTGFKLPSSDEHWARGFPSAAEAWLGGDLGCRAKGLPPLCPWLAM
jgi:hypothetical protein